MSKPETCDIFCAVVDNYGDIGVCWRLARQLAHEHNIEVRLWVDDLVSFRRLCPEIDPPLSLQRVMGVEVRRWSADAFPPLPQPLSHEGERGVADLVIEAFACNLPERYVAAMAKQADKPVWINLEHLSAEDWVAGCHGLPSPHPSLPLTKYFFFPGFTPDTGGLLLERDLMVRRDTFQGDPQAMNAFWQALGVPPAKQDEVRVSLFSYENTALPKLLAAWAEGDTPIRCLLPEGRALPQVVRFFGREQAAVGEVLHRGQLEAQVLPFMRQDRYDELLWASDINFVRGEDSCVRAQWAGKPFVWHIYPQHDGVHSQKLRAFMTCYGQGLPAAASSALHQLWEAWNGEGDATAGWQEFYAQREVLRHHTQAWAQRLLYNNLALNLLDFFRQVGRIRAS